MTHLYAVYYWSLGGEEGVAITVAQSPEEAVSMTVRECALKWGVTEEQIKQGEKFFIQTQEQLDNQIIEYRGRSYRITLEELEELCSLIVH